MATTFRGRILGIVPTAVTAPRGEIAVTVSPTNAPSVRATSRPSAIVGSGPARSARSPCFTRCRSSRRSASGSIPRSTTPVAASPCESITCWSTNGAAERTAGWARTTPRARAGSSMPRPPTSITRMCEVVPRILLLSSSSKPDITARTTMSAMTPIAIPAIAIRVRRERKPRPPLARR
jgi:hypothetical protein